uniref:M35 family metallopeptidase n=1 Tax=Falsiroseomonas oryzae TaxID=2766473 RepID=UPI0022EA4390
GAIPPDGHAVAGEAAFGKPGAALRHPADIPGPACAAEHRRMIDEARGVARERIAEAVSLLRQQPDHPHVTRWFGTAPRPEIALRLQRTAAWLERPDSLKILCNDLPSCGSARMAYAAMGGQMIGLCPAFFRAGMGGRDNRWGILIHETSHVAAGTLDHAYGHTASLVLAKADPRRAAQNADSYEYFVETLPR